MEIINKFDAREFEDKEKYKNSMPYRLFVPDDYSALNKYPLILYLHGGGGRGDDNLAQVEYGATILIGSTIQAMEKSFVLVPQCPKRAQWLNTNFKNRPFLNYQQDKIPESETMKMVIELITKLQNEFSIDPTRLYATGPSMGGSGTWDIITRYPNLFAAAVPINGVSDPSKAIQVANLPIWAFHGENDEVSDINNTRNMIRALRNLGSNCRFTEYKNEGHIIDGKVYDKNEHFLWLFKQKKNPD